MQAAARPGQPGQELVRAAAGIGADQHPPPQLAGQLGQRQPGSLDVIGGGVGPGVARPQHDGQRFPGAFWTVVGEGGQRVEPEGLLPGRAGLLLLRAGGHDRGVEVNGDQTASAGCRVPGQLPGPCPGGGPRSADRLQRPRRVRGQGTD